MRHKTIYIHSSIQLYLCYYLTLTLKTSNLQQTTLKTFLWKCEYLHKGRLWFISDPWMTFQYSAWKCAFSTIIAEKYFCHINNYYSSYYYLHIYSNFNFIFYLKCSSMYRYTRDAGKLTYCFNQAVILIHTKTRTITKSDIR